MKRVPEGSIDPRDIRVECSWCSSHVRGRPEAEYISHGICGACRERILAEFIPAGLPEPSLEPSPAPLRAPVSSAIPAA